MTAMARNDIELWVRERRNIFSFDGTSSHLHSSSLVNMSEKRTLSHPQEEEESVNNLF